VSRVFLQDTGAHQQREFAVVVVHRGEQLVGDDPAALDQIRAGQPSAAHLPAAFHVTIHLGQELHSLSKSFTAMPESFNEDLQSDFYCGNKRANDDQLS